MIFLISFIIFIIPGIVFFWWIDHPKCKACKKSDKIVDVGYNHKYQKCERCDLRLGDEPIITTPANIVTLTNYINTKLEGDINEEDITILLKL